MSQYLHIFVENEHTYTPLLCVSRSTCIYQLLNGYLPYGKITMLTPSQIKDSAEFALGKYEEMIQRNKDAEKMMANISTWNNTVDEKLELLTNIQQSMAERESEKDEWLAAHYYLAFLSEIGEDNHLYAGIECGKHVTDADVED